MSDEIIDILGDAMAPRPRDPRAHFGPRVRGGPPLDGGPKLDVQGAFGLADKEPVASAGVPPRSKPAQTAKPAPATPAKPAATPAGAFRLLNLAHKTRRPHVAIERPATATPVPEAGKLLEQAARGETIRRIDPAHHHGAVLETAGLAKSFSKASVTIPVLRGVDLAGQRGEFLAIVGQSGSGKSTLLHLLGTLDAPEAGEIRFEGRRIDALPSRQRDLLRNRHFGMIFQFYHLLPELSMLENVLVPMMIGQSTLGYLRRRREYRRRAEELLETVGLSHRLAHKPRELSGGEMQRTAIARALVHQPSLLLADEPTGNLDHETGQGILDVLHRLNEEQKLTVVMVTHDAAIADSADRVVRLVDGRLA